MVLRTIKGHEKNSNLEPQKYLQRKLSDSAHTQRFRRQIKYVMGN